jgi:hypothetical protein
MTTTGENTSHTRSHCPGRLAESFWLPSYCPNGLASSTRRLDALTDAEEVTWDGGPRATASYRCGCCGATWNEDWPAVMVVGPGWRHREPVHWTAGIDAPRRTAGWIELDLWRAAAHRRADRVREGGGSGMTPLLAAARGSTSPPR